jgi:polyisoprenoid-binding protein YceI
MSKSLCWLVLACLIAVQLLHGQEAPLDVKASSIKFTGHAFMHDFTGEPKKFTGFAQMSPTAPQMVTSAKILIQAAAMTTFEDARDKNMKTWLQVNADPDIVFTLTKVKPFAGEPRLATEKAPARFSIEGELLLHGKKHGLSDMADGWRTGSFLIVSGKTSVNTEDYGLPQIRQFFLTVDKKVDITYRLVFDLPPFVPSSGRQVIPLEIRHFY